LPPAWDHHAVLPTTSGGGMSTTLILGELDGERSPGQTYSPIVGLDVSLTGSGRLPLEPDFEYAVLSMLGAAEVDDVQLTPGSMLYLGHGHCEIRLTSESGVRLLVLGGEPFGEQIVMWWNFVGRSDEEVRAARSQWMARERFGEVADAGDPTPAPEMPAGRLRPVSASRE
jgi:redox-sensitive bicupin YhaK (pirin superfamily)